MSDLEADNAEAEDSPWTTRTRWAVDHWDRSERWRAPALLVGGFLWDWTTLRRIDRLQDNLLLMAYLIALGLTLAVELRVERGGWVPAALARWRRGIHLASQFLFGALFSAYVVFYSMSASVGRGLLWLAMLGVLLVVNEFADRRLRGGLVRSVLFGLCAFSFLLFFIPVVLGWLTGWVPAAVGALVLTVLLLWVAHVRLSSSDPEVGRVDQGWLSGWLSALGRPTVAVALAIGAVAVLRSFGFVPPVPLSLTQAGIFHEVQRTDAGYQLTWERQGWLGWRRHDAVMHWDPGDRVWCFTAIFAPQDMELDIVHRWWHRDPEQGWVDVEAIDFDLQGGRLGGFRGFTHKENVWPGKWMVSVETSGGERIGELRFEVVEGPEQGPLVERTY